MGALLSNEEDLGDKEVRKYAHLRSKLRDVVGQMRHGNVNDVVGHIKSHKLNRRNLLKKFKAFTEPGDKEMVRFIDIYLTIEAAKSGHVNILKVVLSNGYKPESDECDKVEQPLHIACSKGYTDMVKYLVVNRKVRVNVRDQCKKTPLICALEARNVSPENKIQIVKILIEARCEVNVHDMNAFSPLFFAIGTPSVVKFLIDKGADVNYRCPVTANNSGGSLLHKAVVLDCCDSIGLLLDSGADLEMPNNDGQTPFMFACNHYSLHVAKLLHSRGADPEASDPEGRTPLKLALCRGRGKIVEFLCWTVNVNMSHEPDDQRTPLICALREHHYSVIKKLLLSGYQPTRFEYDAVHYRWLNAEDPEKYKPLEDILHIMSSPKSLQEECVFFIKRNFGVKLSQNIDFITLPQNLKRVIQTSPFPE